MRRVRIFQQGTSATQSGKARQGLWVLEHEPAEPKRPDPLMGWAGSGDTDQQIRLTFPTRESAEAYAISHGLAFTVVPAPPHRLILQSYADNFR